MRAAQTIAELARFDERGGGTDSERRAAIWLRDQLEASGREAGLEAFWARPNTALAHAWHLALGLAGSLVAVHNPRIGGALVLVALLSIVVDALTGVSPGRRLTPEHASQNVVATRRHTARRQRVRLIITANYDAGRSGLVYRAPLRRATAKIAQRTGLLTPGWLGWLALALVWVLAVAVARLEGSGGAAIGIVQVIPTIALVLALALLLELGSSGVAPAAGDNASGVGVAVALARALDVAPPRHLNVELVLQGASDASGTGLRRHLRRHRRKPAETVVLGIAACSAGTPRWWTTDGQLVTLRYSPVLNRLCKTLATDDPALGVRPHRGHGASPALPGRSANIAAITIGCLDDNHVVPRSHQSDDTPDQVDQEALDRALEFGLLLVDAIDSYFAERAERPAAPA